MTKVQEEPVESPPVPSVVESATPLSRDEARAKIFASRQPKKEVFEFFGVQVELRQPTLGSIINAQSTEDRQAGVVQAMIDYAFIPGTDIKLFSEEDAASFIEMPFGPDFIRATEALQKLTEVNFRDKKSS